MTDKIRGAGGGGGKGGGSSSGHVPVESPDSLRSRQYARLIDLVSEGEIYGLVDGLKSVYLDDTPIQNSDGSYNFSGIRFESRTGTQLQSYIAGFPAVENEVGVSTEVQYSTPVVRSITNTNLNALRVTVAVPALTYQNPSTGDLGGTSVAIAIDVNNNGAGWVQMVSDTISGKTTSRYQRAYRIELPAGGPWDIRVRRITADSTKSNLQNATWWDTYTEIIDSKLRYPNSALVALQVDSAQFRSIPRRGYEIKGLLVRVPSNYNPSTRAYTGTWDGTWQIAWSDNPAWCWYDLITSPRYGLGEFVQESQVDKWALYSIAQYCDELVPDGFGGTEPRFTCNLYLQAQEEAYRVVANMASIFRAVAFWSAGAITAVQDAPADPIALFTQSNIIGGEFSYTGSSGKARHTVALITWNDPADMYRQKVEYVEDQAGIARYGVTQTQVVAIGCTSRGQAHRVGKWLLYSERLETETVTFRTGLDGCSLYPGAVISTHDSSRAGVRWGGRVVASMLPTITLDSSVTLDTGVAYTLAVVMPDGSIASGQVLDAPGTTSIVTVSGIATDPVSGAIWVLSSDALVAETWRVVTMSEVEKSVIEVTALAHNPSKYDAVELDTQLEVKSSTLIQLLPAVNNITMTESLYQAGGGVVLSKVTLAWESTGVKYTINYRPSGGNYSTVQSDSASVEIAGLVVGDYDFEITGYNALGQAGIKSTATFSVLGDLDPPDDVTGVTSYYSDGVSQLVWDAVTDIRPVDYEIRLGSSWGSAKVVGRTVIPRIPTIGNGTYFIAARYQAQNGSHIYSITPSAAVVTGAALVRNVLAEHAQAPAWPGTVSGGLALIGDELFLQGAGDVLTIADVLSEPDMLWYGGVAATGQYDLPASHAVNAGRVAPCIVSMSYTARGQAIDDNSLTWADVFSISDVLGYALGAVINIRPQIALAGADGIYGPWQAFVPGTYNAQYYKGRVIVESADAYVTGVLADVVMSVDVPDRLDAYSITTSITAAVDVNYTSPFNGGPGASVLPLVQATLVDAQAGDDVRIIAPDLYGCSVEVINSGVRVARTLNVQAQGY